MKICYNILIHFYRFVLWISSFFISKNKEIVKYQRKILKKITESTRNEKQIVWFHVASLGEFEQGKSILSAYKKKYQSHKILLTVYSPSAYNIIKNYKITNWVFYLPHDSSYNAKMFVEKIKPIKAIFIKYEFWYNYINELYKNDIPLYYASSIFRKEQYFFTFYGKWFAKQLRKVTHFFVQNEESKILLNNIGIHQIMISGDSRFDSARMNKREKYSNKIITNFINNSKIIVAGSTWRKDEKIIQSLLNNNSQNYKLIIAPHELDSIQHLRKIKKSIFLSESNDKLISDFNVLIIDQIGILSKLYRYANIAYVGGGFQKEGIHNVLEAIIYNIPVIFGPNYHKSQEAKELIERGIAKSISNSSDLKNSINYFNHTDVTKSNKEYLKAKIGAVHKIMEII